MKKHIRTYQKHEYAQDTRSLALAEYASCTRKHDNIITAGSRTFVSNQKLRTRTYSLLRLMHSHAAVGVGTYCWRRKRRCTFPPPEQ